MNEQLTDTDRSETEALLPVEAPESPTTPAEPEPETVPTEQEPDVAKPPASGPPPARTDVEPNFKGAVETERPTKAKAPASKKASSPKAGSAAAKKAKAPASKKTTGKAPASKAPASKKAAAPKAPKVSKAGQFRAAALKILGARKTPLTVKELTDKAIEAGLLSTTGVTPDRTMATLLYTDTTGAFARVIPQAAAGKTRANGVRWTLAEKV